MRRASDVENASEDVATRERAVALGAVALGAVAITLGSGVADAGDLVDDNSDRGFDDDSGDDDGDAMRDSD